LSLFFFEGFLLFSLLELLVSDFPKLSKLPRLFVFSFTLFLSAFDLQGSGSVDSLLHLEFAALLFFVQAIGFIFSFGDLFVEHVFLSIFEGTKLLNLTINHLLTDCKLFFESSLLTVLALLIHHKLLLGECLDPRFFGKLFLSDEFGLSDLVRVCLHDISFDFCCFFLSLEFSNFFTFEVLFSLTLDEFALQHFLFKLLNVVDFEFVELIGDCL